MPDRSLDLSKRLAALALACLWPGGRFAFAAEGAADTMTRLEEPLTDADREHWSFKPARRIEPPHVENAAWVRNPIDRFILARLEVEGFEPLPPADRATLLRRVTFDLTGLPPTPGELVAFLADRSPGAWESVVDRLLGSPAYGERDPGTPAA